MPLAPHGCDFLLTSGDLSLFQWYRAKIGSVDRQRGKFKVLYIDFGNSELISLKDIYKCPPNLHPSKYSELARHCTLSGKFFRCCRQRFKHYAL